MKHHLMVAIWCVLAGAGCDRLTSHGAAPAADDPPPRPTAIPVTSPAPTPSAVPPLEPNTTSLEPAARGAPGAAPGAAPAVAPGGCSPAFAAKANALVNAYVSETGNLGVAVGIYDNGKSCEIVSGRRGVDPRSGPITGDTILAMGSVQKVFNSTLLAYELVQGKASLDDPAAKYLVSDDGRTVAAGVPFSRITLKELSTHTAELPSQPPHASEKIGWSLYRDRPLPGSVIAFLDAWRPRITPGTRYEYSNLGFVLIGHVTTALAQRSYTALLSEALTGPLGMTHTARNICDSANPFCADGQQADGRRPSEAPVGLWTSARDMERFIEAHLGVLQVSPVLARAMVLTHGELFRQDDEHANGMGWEIWHSGDALQLSKNGIETGFLSWMAFEPARHRGIAVLVNGVGKPLPKEVGLKILDAMTRD